MTNTTYLNKILITGPTEELERFYLDYLDDFTNSKITGYGIEGLLTMNRYQGKNWIEFEWTSHSLYQNHVAYEIGCKHKYLQVRMIYLKDDAITQFKNDPTFTIEEIFFKNGRYASEHPVTSAQWESLKSIPVVNEKQPILIHIFENNDWINRTTSKVFCRAINDVTNFHSLAELCFWKEKFVREILHRSLKRNSRQTFNDCLEVMAELMNSYEPYQLVNHAEYRVDKYKGRWALYSITPECKKKEYQENLARIEQQQGYGEDLPF